MNLDKRDSLDILAERLALNMVSSSFPSSEKQKIFDDIFKPEMKYRERSRNILIIGAGATHSLCNEIPLANKFSGILKDKFEEKYKAEFYDRIVKKELDRLTNQYKLVETEFETQLAAYSRFDKELVLDVLAEKYNLKYNVSLFYEIVAHLFKHRFIDVIINFNFDEILDNAIEEEMTSEEYKFIYSDGHCPAKNKEADEFIKSGRISVPVYIKPHGTISHGSTLRFTRHDYYNLPMRLKETLKFLIGGETDDDKFNLPVNLIVAGFGLGSFELNSIIEESLKNKLCSLFYFDKFAENEVKDFDGTRKPKDLVHFTNDNSRLIPLNTSDRNSPQSLDNTFYNLWFKMADLFNEAYVPKGINRHVIIAELFNPIASTLLVKENDGKADYDKQKTMLADYFRQRLIVELGLEILICNDGIMNLTNIQQGRVGKYYNLLRKEGDKTSLFDFIRDLGLMPYRKGLIDTWKTENTTEFKKMINDRVKNSLSNSVKRYTNEQNISDKLTKAIAGVKSRTGMFLNIVPSFIENKISVFEGIDEDSLINTDIKWIYQFKKYFYNEKELDKWDIVLSISESGSVFSENKIANALKGKKIVLICSYNSVEGVAEKSAKIIEGKLAPIKDCFLLDENKAPILKFLSYRNHNQHVTLFCKINAKEITPVYGIYYQRRLMSRKVSPIIIKKSSHLDMMKSIFFTYFERSVKEERYGKVEKSLKQLRQNYIDNKTIDGNDETLVKLLKMSQDVENTESYLIERYFADAQG